MQGIRRCRLLVDGRIVLIAHTQLSVFVHSDFTCDSILLEGAMLILLLCILAMAHSNTTGIMEYSFDDAQYNSYNVRVSLQLISDELNGGYTGQRRELVLIRSYSLPRSVRVFVAVKFGPVYAI